MCNIVRDRKDGVTVWLNNDPEPMGKDLEDKWDLVVKGPCDEVARYANMRRWDDSMDYQTVTDEDLNKVREKQKAEVVIGTPRKPGVLRNAGQLTPGQSPRILPKSFIKEEPDTPSKKGTKRKVDAQLNLFGKPASKADAKKPKAQPKKAAAGKSKAKKEPKKEDPAITNVFKATKSTVRPTTKAAAKSTTKPATKAVTKADLTFINSEYNSQPERKPKENSSDVSVDRKNTPATPKKHERLTKLKAGYVMVPIPANNQRPPVETITPVKAKARTPEDQLQEEMATASSQRHKIQSPTGAIPKNMEGLLC
jgi:NAD-dependent histone deacetylase SIR2